MQFKHNQKSSIPEVNLVPMIDVLMSVLIFFIITAMTLTTQSLGNINLPSSQENTLSTDSEKTAQSLIIGLDKNQLTFIDNQPVDDTKLINKIENFLTQNPSGQIILKADKDLSYQEISQFLNKLSKVSSQPIFLAIETSQ